jgi:signal transduction histidine kinase
VSDAIATKSRLIQTERLAAIGRMAAHVTHEVRNPLSSIGLNVDMLGDEIHDTGPESKRLMESIQQELERLENIAEEYLRLARLDVRCPRARTQDPDRTPDRTQVLVPGSRIRPAERYDCLRLQDLSFRS